MKLEYTDHEKQCDIKVETNRRIIVTLSDGNEYRLSEDIAGGLIINSVDNISVLPQYANQVIVEPRK